MLYSFVSAIHLLVGVVYCLISWAVGLPKRAVSSLILSRFCIIFMRIFSFLGCLIQVYDFNKQPIDKELLGLLTPVAFCHALGHVMSNVSFAAVAVSFTHTIKGSKKTLNFC